ncbi:hypothetical protein C1645_414034 [Glomus cerebriforme]|uniref:Uncharacterized protein n=1 Tax=Glomus cerebriforme TaxID=658196 RepID=A0A397TMP0_9GLOM|nr:hypothetical protein C1645_414034 [Glomus cerebriforme]
MSRTNLQIVEETIDIEQQVKAAELKAQSKIKQQQNNNSNSKRSSSNVVNVVEHSSIESDRQKSVNTQQQQQQQQHSEQLRYSSQSSSKPKENNKFNNSSSNHDTNNFVIPQNVEPPETISTYIITDRSKTNKLRHGIPITPTSPDFGDASNLSQENVTRRRTTFIPPSRDSKREEYFKKHFPDLKESISNLKIEQESNDCEADTSNELLNGLDTIKSESDEKRLNDAKSKGNQLNTSSSSFSIKTEDMTDKEPLTDFEDDEEEQIDQLQPSDRSDSEMEGIEPLSSTSTSKSPMELESQTDDSMSIDTSNIWHVPIEGTTVSPGLTPHRKRKIIIVEDSDDDSSNIKRSK